MKANIAILIVIYTICCTTKGFSQLYIYLNIPETSLNGKIMFDTYYYYKIIYIV